MKGYKDYMDNIYVDDTLHKKIMSQVTGKTMKQRRIVLAYRFAAVVAYVAVLLLGVWAINNRMFANPQNCGVLSGYTTHVPNGPVQTNPVQNEDNTVNLVFARLTFNGVETTMSASMLIPDGYFDHDITEAQLHAVLPNQDMALAAVANYRCDGTLWFVAASEYEWVGTRRRFTWTTIHLGYEGVLPDSTLLFPTDTPIISDVHGVQVTAFVYGVHDEYFRADFVLDGVAYRVETSDMLAIYVDVGERDGMERLTRLVNEIILHGVGDLSVLANPIIPELRNDRLTMDEARLEDVFGAFIPHDIPYGFTPQHINRLVNTRMDSLFVVWGSGMETISWNVRIPLESDFLSVVSVVDREKYDVSLYTIPWFDSVPAEFHYYFQSPVFHAEELSLDVIESRTRLADGRGDTAPRFETSQFAVLFGDVIVEVSMSGIAPDIVWELFQEVMR